ADRGSAGPAGQLHREGARHRGGAPERDLRGPALQPGQPRRALPHDRPGDLGADRRQNHALRVRSGHGGHRERGRALSQGAAPDHPRDRRRPRRLDLFGLRADTGERYLSKVFNDEWLRENQILDAERVSVAQLLEARNSGAPPLISVPPTATVRQALNLMSTYNVSQLPVLDGGDGVGAVAEPVLMARALEEPATLDRPVQEVMDAPYPV